MGGTHWPQVGEEDGGGGRSGRDLKATIGTLREGVDDDDMKMMIMMMVAAVPGGNNTKTVSNN